MTDPHPLTDEMCENISYFPLSDMPVLGKSIKKDMRAAYDKGRDDQLEQVVEWLFDNLYWVEEDGSLRYISGEMVSIDHHQIIEDLEKAMRPQQQEDNS